MRIVPPLERKECLVSPRLQRRAWIAQRDMQILRTRGLKLTSVGSFVQFRERGSRLACRHHLLWVDGHPNWVGDELWRGAHPLAGVLPTPEVVGLQFDTVAVGVFIVEGGGQTMVEAGVWHDTLGL